MEHANKYQNEHAGLNNFRGSYLCDVNSEVAGVRAILITNYQNLIKKKTCTKYSN